MENHNRCPGCMEEKTQDTKCPHCGWMEGSAPESALHLPPGTVLQEKYLIGKALGQGGFGLTYLAYDLNLNMKLAVKEYLPQELAYRTGDQSEVSIYKKSLADNFNYGLAKFLEEARTLAQFNEHPNIVSVRDFFKTNGTAYLVMNHIEGVTLKEYLTGRDKPLPFDQALDIFMPVLDALKVVHAAGILHRDISPDNLLLDSKGRVVLIDFGAARQAMGDKSRSMSVIMKAGYSPEEQYRSKGEQGPWTDIYAVAATMYHAITGIMPPESLDRLTEDTLTSLSELGLKIEPYQENALLKAMEVWGKNRYQSVEEFQVALNKSADGFIVKTKFPAEGLIKKDTSKASAQDTGKDYKKGFPPGAVASKPASDLKPVQESAKAEAFFNEPINAPKLEAKKNSYSNIYYACGLLLFVGLVVFMINTGSEQGSISYKNGTFTGDVLNFKPNGKGTWVHPDGYEYTGEYKDGEMHEQGTYTWANGSQYVGEFKEDKMHGHGTYTWADGSKYTGEHEDGLPHGHGTFIYSIGDRYVGEFKEGLRHGQGEYYWSDGATYVGAYNEGERHGEGIKTLPDGKVLKGNFENGEYVGP